MAARNRANTKLVQVGGDRPQPRESRLEEPVLPDGWVMVRDGDEAARAKGLGAYQAERRHGDGCVRREGNSMHELAQRCGRWEARQSGANIGGIPFVAAEPDTVEYEPWLVPSELTRAEAERLGWTFTVVDRVLSEKERTAGTHAFVAEKPRSGGVKRLGGVREGDLLEAIRRYEARTAVGRTLAAVAVETREAPTLTPKPRKGRSRPVDPDGLEAA